MAQEADFGVVLLRTLGSLHMCREYFLTSTEYWCKIVGKSFDNNCGVAPPLLAQEISKYLEGLFKSYVALLVD
jgi:hypothetical protein